MGKFTDYVKQIITFIANLDAGIAKVATMSTQLERQLDQINNMVEAKKI